MRPGMSHGYVLTGARNPCAGVGPLRLRETGIARNKEAITSLSLDANLSSASSGLYVLQFDHRHDECLLQTETESRYSVPPTRNRIQVGLGYYGSTKDLHSLQ